MKLSGKNFQPWPDFDLDIAGLTILTGPSNEGKSSIYRALKGLLRNEIQPSHIRDPKDEPLEITVKVDDYTIRATRSKKGTVHYFVNHPTFEKEKEYSKLAEDVPPEVKDLKFGEIKVGDFTFDPIFATQNESQFLIDNKAFKPGEINAVLGAFGGTEKLEAGKKQANLLKTQKDSEARTLAAQIRDAEERKGKLVDMIATGEASSQGLKQLEDEIALLEEEAYWYGEALAAHRALQPLHEIIEALILPDTREIEQLKQTVGYLDQAADSLRYYNWLKKPLTVIDGAGTPWSEIIALWKVIRAIESAADLHVSGAIDKTALQGLTELSNQFNELIVTQHSIRELETAVGLRRQLKESAIQLADIDTQLAAAQAETDEIQAELRKGLCPKCGKSVEHVCQ